MPHFCKTRICYWENEANNINAGNYAAKIQSNTTDTNDFTNLYKVCRVEGKDHNWHIVPTDIWGLYCSSAEFMSMMENFSSFTPVNIKVTIAHTIPLAKYAGSTNTTQLSFNNTIFSLTYILNDTDNVSTSTTFPASIDDAYDFFRTFDGSSFKDNTRALLPKVDIFYKVPNAVNEDNTDGNQNQPNSLIYPIKNTAGTTMPGNVIREMAGTGQTIEFEPLRQAVIDNNNLKLAFYPDFLQDTGNVKALYPGENQDQFTYTCKNTTAATINCESLAFNQSYKSADERAYGMNSNVFVDHRMLLNNRLFPRMRGPQQHRATQGLDPTLKDQAYLNDVGFEDFTIDGCPKWFLKGVPILDPDNSLVPHSFMGTIVWELECEGTPKPLSIPRTLRWGHLYPEVTQYIDTLSGTTGQTGTSRVMQRYMNTWPKRPFNDSHMHGKLKVLRRRNLNAPNASTQFVYPPFPGNDAAAREAAVLNADEFDPNLLRRNNNYEIPTKTFIKVKPPGSASVYNLRSKRTPSANASSSNDATVPSS